jgi:ubiquinol-cytochrome c reductase cytochrome b subunit
MSLWGFQYLASNVYLLKLNFNFIMIKEYLELIININYLDLSITSCINLNNSLYINKNNKLVRIPANKHIGPLNKDILDIIFGSLLGDGHAERRIQGKGTRITFYQEGSHVTYLLWLHNLISNLGYCNPNKPKIQNRLGKKGIVRKIIRFRTWTYSSFNWIHELWYINNIKTVPSSIGEFITPLSLAIWIMDDGGKLGSGLKLSTNAFSYENCMLLTKVLFEKFNIKSSIQSTGIENQFHIYIWKESMSLLRNIVMPFIHPSMKYKII